MQSHRLHRSRPDPVDNTTGIDENRMIELRSNTRYSPGTQAAHQITDAIKYIADLIEQRSPLAVASVQPVGSYVNGTMTAKWAEQLELLCLVRECNSQGCIGWLALLTVRVSAVDRSTLR